MLILFSDLDGTLLDSTYHYDAAIPALKAVEERGVPVILCSSKTRAEMETIRASMGNMHPFIPENGGAAIIPLHYFPFTTNGEQIGQYEKIRFGANYIDIVNALQRASESTGVPVRGFSQMTVEEVAQETGLSPAKALLAARREYDEPFLIPGAEDEAMLVLLRAIAAEGMRWTRGGRFFHIMGASDKAKAARAISDCYAKVHGRVTTVALGDALNDVELLEFADIPVIVRSPQTRLLAAMAPSARVTRLAGPAGWNETVLEILREQTT